MRSLRLALDAFVTERLLADRVAFRVSAKGFRLNE